MKIRIILLIGLMLSGCLDGFLTPAMADQSCDQSAVITVAAANTGKIVTGVDGKVAAVCSFVITGDTAATVAQFKAGTGSTCQTGTTNKTGAMLMPANGNISYGSGVSELFFGAITDSICLTATTGAVTGALTFKIR